MEGGNLLAGGIETLNEIKENLLELQGYKEKNASLIAEEKKLEKSIENLEKQLAEEIQTTTRKRRQEIEDTFDKQISKTRARMRKIKDKRDKKKSKKVFLRIEEETAELRAENNRLRLEAKTLFKQNRVPSLCNTKLYYALYSPKCFTDFLVILLTLLIVLVLIPCGIYYFALPQKMIYLIITYIATVLVFGMLYVIGNRIKEKHLDQIAQVKGIRSSIRVNKKKIAVIKNNIRKDRDESSYGLENYDAELQELEREEADISNQKKEALATFDHTTVKVIAAEIEGIYAERLNAIRQEYDNTAAEVKRTEEKIKALTLKVASEYEPYIGKDLMTLDRLESLSNILLAGTAQTISEAITFYRQSLMEAGLKK